jgi:hypothetical protein
MSARDIQTELPPARDDATLATGRPGSLLPPHLEKYRQYIQHLALTEAHQRELLEAL